MSNQDSAMAPETLSFLHESKKTHLIGGHWADCKDETPQKSSMLQLAK